MRSYVNRQASDRRWGIWDLDAELRYWPVLDVLPAGAVCEIGSGTAGLASWTDREIIGVDPNGDEWHEGMQTMPNLRRVAGSSTAIPLADASVSATVAVDTFEHIWPAERRASVDEMIRVTAPGGRVVINGPTGGDAAHGDRWLWDSWQPNPPTWLLWLTEHFERGVPGVDDMEALFTNPRIATVRSAGYLNIHLWRFMHSYGLGARSARVTRPIHPLIGRLARRWRRGPCYRTMFVLDLQR